MGTRNSYTRFVLPLILLPILVLLAYGNSLHNDWQFDDWSSIVNNEAIQSLSNTAKFFTDPRAFKDEAGDFLHMFRPLLLVSYALTYAIGGLSLPVWHIVQIAFHIGCTLLVFLLIKETIKSEAAALFAAAFFAVHPIHSQAVNYLSSRSELQASFFYLLALIFFIYSYRDESNKSKFFYLLSPLCLAAALLTKSIAVTLPAVLVCWLWFIEKKRSFKAYLATSPHFLVTAAFVLFRHLIITWTAKQISHSGQIIHSDYYTTNSRPFFENLIIQAGIFWRYLGLLFSWDQISAIHHIEGPSAFCYFSILAIVALLSALFYLRKDEPEVVFCSLFFMLIIAPTSIIPLNLPMNEHRIYLASASIFGLIAHLIARHLRSNHKSQLRYALACTCLLLCLCIAYTRDRNTFWQTPIKLWQDALKKAPHSRYAHAQYAVALFRHGHFKEGVWEMEIANRLHGKMTQTLSVTAATYHNQLGNIHLAKHYIERALKRDGRDANTILAAAQVSERFHAPHKTRELLLRLLALQPEHSEGKSILSAFNKSCQTMDQEIYEIKKQIKEQGEKKELLMRLANTLDRRGRYEEAEKINTKLIKQRVLEALLLQGNSLLRQERYLEAAAVFNRLCRIPGTPTDCVQKLVIALAGAGKNKDAAGLGKSLVKKGLELSLDTRFAAKLPPYSGFPDFVKLKAPTRRTD